MNDQPTNDNKKRRRRVEAVVVKRSGAKTASVEVVRQIRHTLYNKRSKWTKRYLVHDEKDQAVVGQKVVIEESRPLSRHKRWTLVEIIDGPTTAETKEE